MQEFCSILMQLTVPNVLQAVDIGGKLLRGNQERLHANGRKVDAELSLMVVAILFALGYSGGNRLNRIEPNPLHGPPHFLLHPP